jgi:tetratricopeptide (TPR) repeat protein
MRPFKLAVLVTAFTAFVPAFAAADDLAVCNFLGSRRALALEACNRILAAGGLADREKALILVSRGLHYGRNEREKGLADIDAAIALQPDLARAWYARGYFNWSTHDVRKDHELRAHIIADYSKAIALKPDYLEAYDMRARMFSNYEKDYDRAIADYSRMIAIKPDYWPAYQSRAIDYKNKGDFERQLADLTEVVKLRHSADAYVNRGIFYLLRKDYEHAVADLNEVLRLDPYHPSALSGLAVALTAKGDYEAALALYDKAIRRAPHLPWIYSSRAGTFLKMGEYDKALADVERVLKVYSKNVSALNTRGKVYEAMGRKEEAAADFRAVLALNTNPKASEESRAGLKRLGLEP